MITVPAVTLVTTCIALACSFAQSSPPLVDSRGPVHNVGMRVTVAPGSVQAPGYKFKNNCTKPDPWTASWIWLNASAGPAGDTPTAGLFRKELRLNAVPSRVRAWVSADVMYRLYVNGRLVARGPADIGKDYDRESRGPQWLYDCCDLTGAFHAGVNVIAAEVFTQDFYTSRVTRGKHGLLLEAKLEFPHGPPISITSNETWRGRSDTAWSGGGFDASREIAGWRQTGFNDSGWANCSRIESVWTPLAASELPPLMEARYPLDSASLENVPLAVVKGNLDPVEINASSAVVLKYDRVLAGYPTFKIDGSNGEVLKIVPGERVGQQSRVLTLKLRDGEQQFEYPIIDSFSVLRLEFSNVTKPIKILDAGANFSSFPVEYAGSFECSDPRLNALWKSSRWLTQICMQTHHLDSPNHQEPICDPGDYLIESHANYYTFGTPWLARQDLRKFGLMLKDLNYRNFHTSYSLLWLQMLMNYWDYTGDEQLVRELAPEVHGLLDTFTSWRGNNGLISEAPNYMFMDWVTIAGFECHHPPAVIGQGYMTAFYYRGLLDGMRVAKLTGDSIRAEKYEMLRKEVFDAFNRELWDDAQGLYRDGKPHETHVRPSQWLPADTDIETFSPHVNALAVLCDLAPAERQLAIMMRVLGKPSNGPVNCQPYFMYFVLEAMVHFSSTGTPFGTMLNRWKIEPDTQTYHEMWTSGDLSHAWGSAPMIQMSSTILGIRPLAPGFKRFSISPRGFEWVRGMVPTPHGQIKVICTWHGHTFTLRANVPAGTEAEVEIPGTASNHIQTPIVWKPGAHSITVQILPTW